MATVLLFAIGFGLHASEQLASYPSIAGHGEVFHLPEAQDQPRDNSKICVDVTKGGPADKLNPAIEKVARFVNIYSQAGKVPASVRISVILHGDATLVALNDAAYAKRFDTKANPNMALLRELRKAGVELLVCGQAIAHKKASHDEIADSVKVAVSGLTVNVNRQQDGYAFIPLH
ncbi:MAG: DsrE family protein [Rhodopirellula sp.]|nr:DsrE family protein [Rhodopirellula sp.]